MRERLHKPPAISRCGIHLTGFLSSHKKIVLQEKQWNNTKSSHYSRNFSALPNKWTSMRPGHFKQTINISYQLAVGIFFVESGHKGHKR
jgi:hypothetical protein